MSIVVAGSGAFGTAMAIALAADGPVTLLGRDPNAMETMQNARENTGRLAGPKFPETLIATADPACLDAAHSVLLCVPTQTLSGYLKTHADALHGKTLIACCKGIDLQSLTGPAQVIEHTVPKAHPLILTGPSFAADIARGLPTALTLAGSDTTRVEALQSTLTTATLRIYRSADVIGAQLGGALKNVIAIAAGACIGANLGESARAALITRGFSEMQQLAAQFGARPETLMGLSGMGDLILTCSSEQSRNYALGLTIGQGKPRKDGVTVEGATTAQAVARIANDKNLDLPVSQAVDDLVSGRADVATVLSTLLSRPLKSE